MDLFESNQYCLGIGEKSFHRKYLEEQILGTRDAITETLVLVTI